MIELKLFLVQEPLNLMELLSMSTEGPGTTKSLGPLMWEEEQLNFTETKVTILSMVRMEPRLQKV